MSLVIPRKTGRCVHELIENVYLYILMHLITNAQNSMDLAQ